MEIPETINTQTLVKDLAKEIRLVEVNIKQWKKGFLKQTCLFLVLNVIVISY